MLFSAHHNVQSRPLPGLILSRGLGVHCLRVNRAGQGMTRKKYLKLWGRHKNKKKCQECEKMNLFRGRMETEQVHRLHHHMKRQSVGWGDPYGGGRQQRGEERGWLVEHGASTSKWAVVNSRYQVRTGCYQTFKAESIRLLLQQGEKRRYYQKTLKTLRRFFKVS